jgi:hypothetical protein
MMKMSLCKRAIHIEKLLLIPNDNALSLLQPASKTKILEIDMIKENLDLIIVALTALTIAMYDVAIDLLISILHMIFEFLHILYEWFELGIEHTVEHLFHTSRHGSQVVTFYILMLIAGLLLYCLWRMFPRLCKHCAQFAQQAWQRRKAECIRYWLSLPLINKVRLLSTAAIVFYLSSFFAV